MQAVKMTNFQLKDTSGAFPGGLVVVTAVAQVPSHTVGVAQIKEDPSSQRLSFEDITSV